MHILILISIFTTYYSDKIIDQNLVNPFLTKIDTLIKDKQSLIKYVEPILFQTYGKKNIHKEKPYKIFFKNGIWIMDGTLPKTYAVGGTFHIEIAAIDGKVIRVTHYK